MKIDKAEYNGKTIRFMTLENNGLLFNTKDVCSVLGIDERQANSELEPAAMDFASVILNASSRDVDFAMWTQENFVGFNNETPIRPNCNDDWNFE